jgi:hypothetical protein
MTTFAALFLSHLIADFPLQTNRIYKLKTESNQGIMLHVAIHLLVASILLENALQNWPVLLVLGIAHFLIDWTKLRYPGYRQTPGFLLDQFAHLLTVVLLAVWRPDLTAVLPLNVMWWGIFLIMLPATLVFLWVWATDLRVDLPENKTVKWACRSLLPISQRLGSVLVVTIAVTTVLFLII